MYLSFSELALACPIIILIHFASLPLFSHPAIFGSLNIIRSLVSLKPFCASHHCPLEYNENINAMGDLSLCVLHQTLKLGE